jgi:hypothetical protein
LKNLKIKFTGVGKKMPEILIDDKEVKLKKNEFGSFEHTLQTEKDSVNIKVKTFLEVNSKWWLLVNLFFFIISVFGIFDYRLPKDCKVMNFETNVKLSDEQNEVNIALANVLPGKPCAEVNTKCETNEILNICTVDERAKKRLKTLKIIKLVSWLAIIAVSIVLVITGIVF